MPARKLSLYPPAASFVALLVGIGLWSVPAALIVGGMFGLAAWAAYFVAAARRAK